MTSFIEVFELQKEDDRKSEDKLTENEDEPEKEETVNEKADQNAIISRTLQTAFLRMSSDRKMKMITDMFRKTRKLHSLAVTLNIFFSVNSKLISYSKISRDSNSTYEQYLNDHNRMLDTNILKGATVDNLEWFENIGDLQQINVLISLMLLSGGNIVKKLYWRLIKLYNERSSGLYNDNDDEDYASHASLDFRKDIANKPLQMKEHHSKNCEADEGEYDTETPSHKKVVEARKQWQMSIAKVKKEIETDIQKLNESYTGNKKKEENNKRSKIKLTDKKSKDKATSIGFASSRNIIASSKINEEEVDWIQLLPVWTVKKIFSYFDEKSLKKFKKVNTYWAIISKEVIAEFKARDHLNRTIKKTKELLNSFPDVSSVNKTEPKMKEIKIIRETNDLKKRLLIQRRKGAYLKQQSQTEEETALLHTRSIINECFNSLQLDHFSFLAQLKPFPIAIPIPTETKTESIDSSISEVSSSYIKPIVGLTTKPSKQVDTGSEESHLSLVPSIIVTNENLTTW